MSLLLKISQSNFRNTHFLQRHAMHSGNAERTQRTREQIYAENLLRSIERFKREYNTILNRESGNVLNLQDFLTIFWMGKCEMFNIENDKVLMFMIERNTEYSPETIDACRMKIAAFHRLMNMYMQSIYASLRSRQPVRMTEMTAWIALDALQKYRCRKYLRLWRVLSWEHQRSAVEQVPSTTIDLETVITNNVDEFLKVVYQKSGRRLN